MMNTWFNVIQSVEEIEHTGLKDKTYTYLSLGEGRIIRYDESDKISFYYYDDKAKADKHWKDIIKDIKKRTRYCAKCGVLMNETSRRYYEGSDCMGNHYGTSYYWECPTCKYIEKRDQ